MAEGEGFEPSVRITVRRLSRAVHSTTLPPFRGDGFHKFQAHYQKIFQALQRSMNCLSSLGV